MNATVDLVPVPAKTYPLDPRSLFSPRVLVFDHKLAVLSDGLPKAVKRRIAADGETSRPANKRPRTLNPTSKSYKMVIGDGEVSANCRLCLADCSPWEVVKASHRKPGVVKHALGAKVECWRDALSAGAQTISIGEDSLGEARLCLRCFMETRTVEMSKGAHMPDVVACFSRLCESGVVPLPTAIAAGIKGLTMCCPLPKTVDEKVICGAKCTLGFMPRRPTGVECLACRGIFCFHCADRAQDARHCCSGGLKKDQPILHRYLRPRDGMTTFRGLVLKTLVTRGQIFDACLVYLSGAGERTFSPPCGGCDVPLLKTSMCNALSHCKRETCYVCGWTSAVGETIPASHWDPEGIEGCPRFDDSPCWAEACPDWRCVQGQCYGGDEDESCDLDTHGLGQRQMSDERRARHIVALLSQSDEQTVRHVLQRLDSHCASRSDPEAKNLLTRVRLWLSSRPSVY
ncbi:hypothetical protein ml_301 [Mollivirus sibericum]|uniref:hypothetical protein n=1 Tax=Mollivirus sibericum TaxID=1678078 RepID=UPI0006B2E803|nr:hypothetical protein ml_301 [Mollivirus sibericum]ALD62103.1 hypothetical protein ml_301 [Mollivirus sibericum]